jgi:hypothetical protein
MNYYAQGGQAHGLKSLTGHQIQTKDGVPSFGIGGSFQKVFKPVVNAGMQAVKAVQNVPGIKQVSDVSTQAFKPIDQALVGLDKQVGKAIPGGWGTIAQVAASMIPGAQPLAVGLGALNGSGVMRKGGSFNLQGAMIGGATAYATSELGEYLRAANGTPDMALLPGETATAGTMPVNASELGNIVPEVSGPVANAPMSLPPTVNATPSLSDIADIRATQPGFLERAGNYVADIPNSISQSVGQAAREAPTSAGNFFDRATSLDTYSKAGQGMSDTVSGIGKVVTGNADKAATAAALKAGTMAPMMSTAGTVYGVMSLADQEAQLNYLKEQKAAGNIAQAEYDQAVAAINQQRDYASDVVSKSPFSTNPSRDTSIGETYYGRGNETDSLYARLGGEERMYAVGGSIDDEYGMDEARGLNQGNLQNGLFGGGITGYAAGGQPRFLSGGGDGMSDDIPATINGNQEARLADGEFVIPADVVSHLGNGSSKAGAKQLYSMMDKVRTARTGRKSQGKQINPRKYLAA